MYSKTIEIKTDKEFTDITDMIQDIIDNLAVQYQRHSMVFLNVMHTTCGLKIMEKEILSFSDVDDYLEQQVPRNGKYHHDKIELREVPPDERKNGYSHIRMLFFNSSLVIPVNHGWLSLGKWQRIILAEMDGAFPSRTRKIMVTVIGED